MTTSTIVNNFFIEYGDEAKKFKDIHLDQQLHYRRDICACLILSKVSNPDRDIFDGAKHDIVYFSTSDEEYLKLSKEDRINLIRCGVFYDREENSLAMFV